MKKIKSTKRLVVFCVFGMLSLLSGQAFSGPAVYAELGFGAYYRDMAKDSVIGAQMRQLGSVSWSHGRMGWQFGADAGYRFWRNFAGELGFFIPQNQVLTTDSSLTYSNQSFPAGSTIDFNTWGMYVAGRIDFPVAADWDATAKLGLAYVHTRVTYHPIGFSEQKGSGNTWSPLLALGLTYHVSRSWFSTLDYMVVTGNSVKSDPYYANKLTGSHVHVPAMQRLSLTVGYLFSL